MTSRIRVSAAAVAAAGCLLLVGCNSSVTPTTGQPAGAAGAAEQSVAAPQQLANISGDYIGSVKDAHGGAGSAQAILAQHKANAGGAIRVKQSSQTILIDVSMTITSANTTSGAMVVDFPPAKTGPVCTFSTTGTYDPATNVLSGSYTAVTGCTGDMGTYKLTQQCHDTVVTGSMPRRENNPHC